jgi:hypothetical protein
MKGNTATTEPFSQSREHAAAGKNESFSQSGKDFLVWRCFGYKRDGFFVEVGVNDPEICSQTLLLECNGWHGIPVGPQSKCCERYRKMDLGMAFLRFKYCPLQKK